MSSWLARALVRWVSRNIEAAYMANEAGANRRERYWAWQSRRVQSVAFPLARRVNHEAMTTQMIAEGWWG